MSGLISYKANERLLLALLTNNAETKHKRLFQHKSHLRETAKQEKPTKKAGIIAPLL